MSNRGSQQCWQSSADESEEALAGMWASLPKFLRCGASITRRWVRLQSDRHVGAAGAEHPRFRPFPEPQRNVVRSPAEAPKPKETDGNPLTMRSCWPCHRRLIAPVSP